MSTTIGAIGQAYTCVSHMEGWSSEVEKPVLYQRKDGSDDYVVATSHDDRGDLLTEVQRFDTRRDAVREYSCRGGHIHSGDHFLR